MKLDSKIFRAYDIRGKAFFDFDEDGFFVIALAFGRYIAEKFSLKTPNIFVSGDGRQSQPELYPAVVSGLKAAGCHIEWGGSLPTPMNYFLLHTGGFDAAIQISASHNPPDDNGLKLTDKDGAVCGEEIQKIRRIAECETCSLNGTFGTCENQCSPKDSFSVYLKKLKSITPEQTTKKIILDAGNAIAGLFYPEAFEAFGHTVQRLYCALDTRFPNHQPDPERTENLRDLQKMIREQDADFGFAFDGDGDRIGILLANGTILLPDKILYCLAADYLSRNPGEKIVIDAMTSAVLAEKIQALGGTPVFSKTGHSYIEETMHKHNAKLGGEQSGHFMFGEDFYGHDDALLAGLRFLRALENTPELYTAITTDWPNMLEFSEKFVVDDAQKFEILERIKSDVLKEYPKALTLDGVRVNFTDGEWAIVRCSNTSPKIAIRMEMNSEARLKEMKSYFVGLLKKHSNRA